MDLPDLVHTAPFLGLSTFSPLPDAELRIRLSLLEFPLEPSPVICAVDGTIGMSRARNL